jgi:hypothetical protein
MVVNEGGQRKKEITEDRTFFVDGDGIPIPTVWHLEPSFVVNRSAMRWHAYWLCFDATAPDRRPPDRLPALPRYRLFVHADGKYVECAAFVERSGVVTKQN